MRFVFPELNELSFLKAKIRNDTAYLSVNLTLQNKSFYTLTIDTVFYQLSLADSLMFSETTAVGLRQARYQTDHVSLPLKLPVKKIMRTIRSLQTQDSTWLEAKAYVVYNTILGRTKIPFTKTTRVKVPLPPHIRLRKLETKAYSLRDKQINAVAHVEIINEGQLLDLNIHRIRYTFVLGNNLVSSKGVFNHKVEMKPGATTQVVIPVTVDVNKPFKVAWRVLTNNDRMPYTLHLEAELDENNIYGKTDIPVMLDAVGKAELK